MRQTCSWKKHRGGDKSAKTPDGQSVCIITNRGVPLHYEVLCSKHGRATQRFGGKKLTSVKKRACSWLHQHWS
jgi:hypothetical protein